MGLHHGSVPALLDPPQTFWRKLIAVLFDIDQSLQVRRGGEGGPDRVMRRFDIRGPAA